MGWPGRFIPFLISASLFLYLPSSLPVAVLHVTMRISFSWLPFVTLLLLAAIAPVWYIRFAVLLFLPVLFLMSSIRIVSRRRTIDPWETVKRDNAQPLFTLNTFPASHYVEKVRWILDEIGGEAAERLYEEEMDVGIIGVFFAGRTVPTLHHEEGSVTAGNSAHIVRYLYAYFLADGRGTDEEEESPSERQTPHKWSGVSNEMRKRAIKLLKPTPERVQWEADIDRLAHDVQMFGYTHFLKDNSACWKLWGGEEDGIPLWQRLLLRVMAPLLAIMMKKNLHGPPGVTPERSDASTKNLLRMFNRVDAVLSDGRKYITGDELCYIDLWWSACIGLLFSPEQYGNGRCSKSKLDWADPRVPSEALEMYKANLNRPSVQFAFRLYAERRAAYKTFRA